MPYFPARRAPPVRSRSRSESRFDTAARERVETAPGTLGSLTSQLDIPEGLEAAVSAALGEWADSVAFRDPGSAHRAVGLVKGAGGGSVAVVSSVSESSTPASEVAAALGLEALVDRLGPGRHPGLASRLLGDVVLVEGHLTLTHDAPVRVTRRGEGER